MGQNLIDSSKPKKCQKLDRPKCIINSCKRKSKHNSGATKEDIEEFFGLSINNENQELVTDSSFLPGTLYGAVSFFK